ncbi:MAG TPA: hypothetical protein DIU39_09630 [Flavobacteriales bacterium]|nr:hypothetical protein [Flavobacteriales bacterium]|tara:strand:+ start:83590 stop:83943 length:354 start_codon:yes stop_codon:yes gene_type:complete
MKNVLVIMLIFFGFQVIYGQEQVVNNEDSIIRTPTHTRVLKKSEIKKIKESIQYFDNSETSVINEDKTVSTPTRTRVVSKEEIEKMKQEYKMRQVNTDNNSISKSKAVVGGEERNKP